MSRIGLWNAATGEFRVMSADQWAERAAQTDMTGLALVEGVPAEYPDALVFDGEAFVQRVIPNPVDSVALKHLLTPTEMAACVTSQQPAILQLVLGWILAILLGTPPDVDSEPHQQGGALLRAAGIFQTDERLALWLAGLPPE